MKKIVTMFIQSILSISLVLSMSCSKDNDTPTDDDSKPIPEMSISIPTTANSWVVNDPNRTTSIITNTGIDNWKKSSTKIRTYFRVERTGEINIGLKAKVSQGESLIKLTFGDETKEVKLSNTTLKKVFGGTFEIDQPGYHYVEIQGIDKDAVEFAEVPDILIGGVATKGNTYFVKDDFYWGRRGPSVHLSYEKPSTAGNIVWFYNEITVPEGEDTVGSYFMANGFGEGYFGIQVNSETERRILFSVWSAYSTDDPNQIPADYKVEELKHGENVTVGTFGNEGSGAQSRRVYNWKAGVTYKFLLKGEPSENNSTDYTAYFFAPEIGKWELIASFRRPKTSTYLVRPHSFLENFITEMGDESRKAFYSNQWIYDTSGTWHEMTKVKFTADATARKESRLDYAGGVENGEFYLKNCGFFSENTVIDSYFTKSAKGNTPDINFDDLP